MRGLAGLVIEKTRRLLGEPLAIALLVASVAGHLLCLPLVNRVNSVAEIHYLFEIKVLVLVSLGCACAGFLLEKRVYFLVVHYTRLIASAIVMYNLNSRGLVINLLLLNLFIVDTALYEPNASAVITSAVVAALYLMFEAIIMHGAKLEIQLIHYGMTVLSVGLTGGGFALVTYYREKVVVDRRTIQDLNTAFDKLTRSNLGLQSYAAAAENTSAQKERNRITRELHDSVGYAMTNIAMTMNASKILIKAQNTEKLENLIENTRDIANRCLHETRTTLYKLRSIDEVEPIGLNTLSHLAKVYGDATGIQVAVEYGNTVQSYGDDIDSTVYRFVQESLTNAFRHSHRVAEEIRIRVLLRQEGNLITARVWDNGSGAKEIKEGIGLKGMRERIERLRGTLNYRNVADGFEIWITVPFTEEPDE